MTEEPTAAASHSHAAPPPWRPLAVLTAAMNTLGSVLILLIMAVILADVAGRGLFGTPLPGTPEIVAMSIAMIVFLQFPSTLRAGRVIAADGLLEFIGRRSVRAEQWLQALYHLLGGAMFAVVGYFVGGLTRDAFVADDYYGSLGIATFAKWPVFAVITFGCAVMSLQYAVLVVQYVRAGRRRERLIEIDPADKVLS